eukprot:528507-Ditylum_brightwellii.AAC.1
MAIPTTLHNSIRLVSFNDATDDILAPVEFMPLLVAPWSQESFPPTCYSNLEIRYVKEANALMLKYYCIRKWTKDKASTPKCVHFNF